MIYLESFPVTVLEKISVSVTLVQTLYLRFLHCLEPTQLSTHLESTHLNDVNSH